MRFDNWNLQMDTFPVRQYDNLTRRLEVSGDIPEGWSWAALLSIGENLNIISLQYGEPGLYVDLTADMIPYAGKYNLQLRATQGDKVRHTNIVQMQVNDSMSGDEVWPELPSEFSQAEQRITELNEHPPKPGDNGFWLIWNVETDQYEPSDIPLPSGGGSGSDGGYYTPEVTQPSDNTMQVSFAASEDDMPPVEPVSVTLPAGPAGRDGKDGTPGLPGQDGFSPTASVTQTAGGAQITITDKSGTTNATITNGKDGTNGADGQTPNITPGNIETLPAGSDVTASITGQTPNLVLNLGIPRGPSGAGVPSTEGVPTDYLLSPAGWVAPPSGGGGGLDNWELINEVTTTEQVHSVVISQDRNGKPISLKNFLLKAFATSELGTTAFIRLSGKNQYDNILTFNKTGTAPSLNFMNSATYAGGLMLAGNGYGGYHSAHVAAFINANSDPPELPITSVEITATAAQTLFDAGSVFTLYGVRQ